MPHACFDACLLVPSKSAITHRPFSERCPTLDGGPAANQDRNVQVEDGILSAHPLTALVGIGWPAAWFSSPRTVRELFLLDDRVGCAIGGNEARHPYNHYSMNLTS